MRSFDAVEGLAAESLTDWLRYIDFWAWSYIYHFESDKDRKEFISQLIETLIERHMIVPGYVKNDFQKMTEPLEETFFLLRYYLNELDVEDIKRDYGMWFNPSPKFKEAGKHVTSYPGWQKFCDEFEVDLESEGPFDGREKIRIIDAIAKENNTLNRLLFIQQSKI